MSGMKYFVLCKTCSFTGWVGGSQDQDYKVTIHDFDPEACDCLINGGEFEVLDQDVDV